MDDKMSIIEMILDPDCEEVIELVNENNEVIQFDQMAVVPLDNKLYAILKPITKLDGVGENEAFVFLIDVEKDFISIVYDFDLCDRVFDIYYDLLDQEPIN